ncbi:MAG TPA: BolA family protein [Burkholderiales bacterium]|jgi:BolA protein|nr:BolA family protein [Burkholderiales bacterium]
MDMTEQIRSRLQPLAPLSLDIADESRKHAGHEGAKSGGHFRVAIVSRQFDGKAVQLRHRMVYAALGDLMQNGIHALSINAQTPDEQQIAATPR